MGIEFCGLVVPLSRLGLLMHIKSAAKFSWELVDLRGLQLMIHHFSMCISSSRS